MTEFKGTKGEWRHGEDNGCKTIYTIIDHHVFEIADTVGSDNEIEDLANAQLISKAPEMLEMLNYISNETDQICNDSGMGYIVDYDDMAKLRKLIKEATQIIDAD